MSQEGKGVLMGETGHSGQGNPAFLASIMFIIQETKVKVSAGARRFYPFLLALLNGRQPIPGATGKSGFLLQSVGTLLHTRDRQLSLPSPLVRRNAAEGSHTFKH